MAGSGHRYGPWVSGTALRSLAGAWRIALWLPWLGFCIWIAGWRTPIGTDLTFFLPERAGILETVLVQQMREGPAARLLMIALSGAERGELASAARRLGERLRTRPDFDSVEFGGDLRLPERLEQRFFPYRYALSPDFSARRLEQAELRAELHRRLGELAGPTGMLTKVWLPRDPTGEWQRVLRAWLSTAGPERRDGVWFSRDGRRALLLARTRASGFDLDGQAAALDAVREDFRALELDPAIALQLGGPGVLGVVANARITADATRLSVLNASLVTLLLFAVYRSWRILGLSLIPLLTGVLSGVALTSLCFEGIHGITLGFGATLVGVAADYPNHLFTHLGAREAPAKAMSRIWPTLRLGLLTNVAGFAGMLFSGFGGLVQLAVFASTGLLAAGAATRWLLPQLAGGPVHLPRWVQVGIPWRPPAGRGRFWRAVPYLLTGAAAAAFLLAPGPLWNDAITALSPVPAELQRETAALGQDFGAPDLRYLVLAIGNDREAALRRAEGIAEVLEQLRATGVIHGYDSPARYLPSAAAQAQRLAALPDAAELRRRLEAARRGTPFRPGAFQACLDELGSVRGLPPLTRDDLAGTPLADRVDALLVPVQDRWAALLPLAGITDVGALTQGFAGFDDASVRLLDLQAESNRLVHDYRVEAVRLLLLSLALIALLLALGLRSWRAAGRVLVPVLLAGAGTALLMASWFGGLTLFHLVSLLLVMGLSLDQSLFFHRDAGDAEERRRTLLSLIVCSSSSVLAFGSLATSQIDILRAIGATVAVGAGLAIGFAALLAPRPGLPR